jgi:hypothetical protein
MRWLPMPLAAFIADAAELSCDDIAAFAAAILRFSDELTLRRRRHYGAIIASFRHYIGHAAPASGAASRRYRR